MRLNQEDGALLLLAMEESFSPDSLPVLLQMRFALRYYNVTTTQKPFSNQVLDVFDYFRARSEAEKLVAAVWEARPSVREAAVVAERIGLLQAPHREGLQALLRAGTPYTDVSDFLTGLSRVQAAVCQVRTPDSLGTGTLIGADLVLTNHHVVRDCIDGSGGLTGVTCRFDYKKAGATSYSTPELDVPASVIIAWSEPAEGDFETGSDGEAGKLDYALLKLSRTIGGNPVVAAGDPREAAPLTSQDQALAMNEGLIVLQHPAGRPMKVDLGAVTWIGARRIRHSVNTEPGSSGAPVFNASLELVALHHAGYAGSQDPSLNYNQAIPIPLILKDLAVKNVSL